MVYTLLFSSSKCSLFHNSNVFGSCIIHILYTGCAKIKRNNSVLKYFKHGINSPFFSSSKCSLFHNSNVSGSCVIHILFTGCAKIKRYNSDAISLTRKWLSRRMLVSSRGTVCEWNRVAVRL